MGLFRPFIPNSVESGDRVQTALDLKIHYLKVSSESAVSHCKNKLFYRFPGGPLASPL